MKTKKVKKMREKNKEMQCRYCTNSKEESKGLQLRTKPLWICMPCFRKFQKAYRKNLEVNKKND